MSEWLKPCCLFSQNHSYLSLAWLHTPKPYKSPCLFNLFEAVSSEAVVLPVHQPIKRKLCSFRSSCLFKYKLIVYFFYFTCLVFSPHCTLLYISFLKHLLMEETIYFSGFHLASLATFLVSISGFISFI